MNPTQTPGPTTALKAGEFKYHCPQCKTAPPPLAVMNSPQPLDVPVGDKVIQTATVRTIVACYNCGCFLAVQFIPMDIEIKPPAQPPA